MKKLIFALVLLLALPISVSADVDLSGMSFDELVALRDQLNLAIWNSAEWQEVTVPPGLWEIGKDIPAGHWVISAYPGSSSMIKYGVKVEDNDVKYSTSGYQDHTLYHPDSFSYDPGDQSSVDIELESGHFLSIIVGSVVFSPYTGKPDLGFSGYSLKTPLSNTASPTPMPSSEPQTAKDVVLGVLREHADQLLVPNGRANRYVNLREEPNSKSKKVCSVSEGTLIPIRTAFYTDKWHQSFYQGQICYVYADYVDLE
ncbi:MAG: hypothetical protein IJ337_08050 [Clostridia bacterium]|nr:hypothetical protein [Clostridia bacterium]